MQQFFLIWLDCQLGKFPLKFCRLNSADNFLQLTGILPEVSRKFEKLVKV